MSFSLPELPRKAEYITLDLNLDFLELFEKIEKEFDHCFLLESLGQETSESRYSIIGFDPLTIFNGFTKHLMVGSHKIECKNPYFELRKLLPTDILSRNYCGGLVGYLGYEASVFFEESLPLGEHPDFPQFQFGLYTDGIIHDKMTGETSYFYLLNNRVPKIMEISKKKISTRESTIVKKIGYSISEENYMDSVIKAKEEILAGNTFQCQLGFKANYMIQGDQFPIYKELRKVNPSPHMFYLKFGKNRLLGASPELLFRLRNGEMETFPLAGSIGRGTDPTSDIDKAKKLLNHPKEIAEHKMLVDLHRNDLGRVAKFGTVKVRKLMDIKKFSHIQHISSEVTGIIRKDEDMFSGLAASFPAGTLSGAPKIESMKIIQRLENSPRGPYGGGVGHFGVNGDCTFCIPIRTLFISDNKAYTQASGGVVYDSTPIGEYNEVMTKLKAMETTLEKFITPGETE